MVDNRSYKIWMVVKQDPDGYTPIRCYTLRRAAEQHAKRLQLELDLKWGRIGFNNRIEQAVVRQIDLVTHDGAHAVHGDLLAAVGRNT